MGNLKSLAKDTVLYGLSSIIGRFLNYLLVPLYTAKLSAASGGYGVVTNVYAYTALLMIILTYGMETGFFYFINERKADRMRVYSTILISVATSSLLFILLVFSFLPEIANAMNYTNHPEYIGMMAVTVAVDAFLSIPFAYLRSMEKARKFVALKLLFIVLNISLNLIYFIVLPLFKSAYPEFVSRVYNPNVEVAYIFGVNLFCTLFTIPFFWKELTGFRYVFDRTLWREIMRYSFPILLLGIVGVLNQSADKIIYPKVDGSATALKELGIYGAASKIAMIMAMLLQAFRYAYEPFVFNKKNDKDNKKVYSLGMKYFLMFTLLAFLGVMAYLDLLRYLIAPDYWGGLRVVPIVMTAEIFMGIYFNLAFWYKLKKETYWGAYFSIAGCIVMLAINVIFIPTYGYMACAWAGLIGYMIPMILSYFVGQKRYPIHYDLNSMGRYVLLTILLYGGMTLVPDDWNIVLKLSINTLLLGIYICYLVKHDFPLRSLPVIGKYFK